MRDCNKPQFVGASIARPSAAAEMQFAFRLAHIVFCGIPTGDIGNYRFCTRVVFHITANYHRQTANGRPYDP